MSNDVPSYKPRANGKPIAAAGAPENKPLPTIEVMFDPDSQAIGLRFDNTQFKTWDFVAAVLEGAKLQAIESGRMARAMAMQQQAMREQAALQQGSQLAEKIHGNILRG